MNCMSNRDNAHDIDIFPDEKSQREVNQTKQVQTKTNIETGLQTFVIHLIPGSTCH